ncbi:MAG: SAM-dependent methyltransferase [Planctomycetota bacterium]|jgi:SAM-dependent methyltransferase
MHAVTESVRAQYERFPYPTQAPNNRQASDARLLLSYVERCRPKAGPIRVLDAGCGRGVGLVGCAVLQPDVHFTGIDLCRTSIDHARAEIRQRGLSNVSLQEVDLMTLEGLEVPDGGFDVILSSGVVHHLADPAVGLAKLASVLAPHGVLSLMLYGRHGRESLYRLVRAANVLIPRDAPLEERLAVTRELVSELQSDPLRAGPWQDHVEINDSEFVDRYLNVNEVSYDIPELLGLIGQGGLQFLRWSEPADWDVGSLLPEGPSRERALALSPPDRWKLVDELFWRPSMELVLCKPGNQPRAQVTGKALLKEPLCLSPELSFQREQRHVRGSVRVEHLRLRVRNRESFDVHNGPAAQALLLLADQTDAVLCEDLVRALAEGGIGSAEALSAIEKLIELEVFARPHMLDA